MDKKQGSSEETVDINPPTQNGRALIDDYEIAVRKCLWTYQQLLRKGVCPEQARMVLPQSAYTEYYVTGSLYAWARAYNLRSDDHAQKEIRDLASEWDNIMIMLFPESWIALTGGEW